eukprot:UN30415
MYGLSSGGGKTITSSSGGYSLSLGGASSSRGLSGGLSGGLGGSSGLGGGYSRTTTTTTSMSGMGDRTEKAILQINQNFLSKKDMSDLNVRLASIFRHNQDLVEDNDKLRTEVETWTMKYQQLLESAKTSPFNMDVEAKSQIERLKARIAFLEKEAQRRDEHILGLNNRIAQLEKELADANALALKLKAELSNQGSFSEQLNTAIKDRDHWKQIAGKAEADLLAFVNNASNTGNERNRLIELLKTEIHHTRQELEKRTLALNDSYQKKWADYERRTKQEQEHRLQIMRDEMEKEKKYLEGKLSKDLRELQTVLDELREVNSHLTHQNKGLDDELRKMGFHVETHKAGTSSAMEEIERMKAALHALEELKSKLQAANSTIATLESQIQTLRAENGNLQRTISQLEQRCKDSDMRCRQAEGQLNQLQQQLRASQSQVANLEAQLSTLRTEHATLQRTVQQLQQRVTDAETRCKRAESELISQRTRYEAEIEKRHKEFLALQDKHNRLLEQIEKLQMRINFTPEVATYKKLIANAEHEIGFDGHSFNGGTIKKRKLDYSTPVASYSKTTTSYSTGTGGGLSMGGGLSGGFSGGLSGGGLSLNLSSSLGGTSKKCWIGNRFRTSILFSPSRCKFELQ